MSRLERTVQGFAAAVGFWLGFLWALERWIPGVAPVLAAGAVPGAAVAAGFGLGAAWLWPEGGPRGGLRMVVAPTGFAVSFVAGAGLTWMALRLAGALAGYGS
ncbi:MAG: hypothetical protein D6708_17100 [Candidatus Dadabacteria bacterium]|nr:MAG: hypothetical protein D6708_17100 [Candidatus Dadabacteria bacterium]